MLFEGFFLLYYSLLDLKCSFQIRMHFEQTEHHVLARQLTDSSVAHDSLLF